MIVSGPVVERFVADSLPGGELGFGNCQAIGFLDGDRLVAGVVYHNWEPRNQVIELSAASKNRKWLTRARLLRIFAYPFDELECRLAVARIGEHNARARRIWRSLGADEYILPALRSPHEAEVIYLLSREAWKSGKFCRQRHNHNIKECAA